MNETRVSGSAEAVVREAARIESQRNALAAVLGRLVGEWHSGLVAVPDVYCLYCDGMRDKGASDFIHEDDCPIAAGRRLLVEINGIATDRT